MAVRCLPRQPGRQRARHGLDGPRAREGDHHPRQEHLGGLRRREDQHHRHPRPRRLRRRGGARPVDGRRRAAPRGRLRGAAAADPLRAPQGARGRSARRARRQQGRPSGRPHRRGRARGRGALPRSRRRPPSARLPDRLLRVARGQGLAGATGGRRGPARWRHPQAAARPADRAHPRAGVRPRGTVAGAGHQPRLVAVPRTGGAVPHRERAPAQGRHRRLVPGGRHHREGEDLGAVHHRGARSRGGRQGGSRRDHRDRRHPRDHDRRDADRPRGPPPAPGDPHRRPEPLDDHRDQHVPAGRQGGHRSSRPGS